MKAQGQKPKSRERGTAIIEFALMLPFMLVFTMLVIDFSRAFFVKNMLHQAAREGVRLLAVSSGGDADLVQARTEDVAENGLASNVTVTVTPAANEGGMGTVECTTEFTWLYPGLLSLIGVTVDNPMTLSASQTMKDE